MVAKGLTAIFIHNVDSRYVKAALLDVEYADRGSVTPGAKLAQLKNLRGV
jgi:hypothetical protein